MSKIRFKQWDDFLLTTVSKIGLYAGAVGALLSLGTPLLWAGAILIPDAFLKLYAMTPWAKKHGKSISAAFDQGVSESEQIQEVIKSTGDDHLRQILDGFCEKAKIDPATVDIYYTPGEPTSLFSRDRKIFCPKEVADYFFSFEGGERILGYMIAHEFSHVAAGDVNPEGQAPRFVDGVAERLTLKHPHYLLPIVGTIMALSPGASSLSMLAVIGAFPLYQKAINFFSKRIIEYRADRNAINLTGDIDAAEDALTAFNMNKRSLAHDIWGTLTGEYPEGKVRLSAIQRAFNTLERKHPERVYQGAVPKPPSP